jgi:GNAT superfamily N-acetyltransferase
MARAGNPPMDEIRVRDVSRGNLDDLCWVCVPPEKRDDPALVAGVELKRDWALGMLQRWGACAKLAYAGSAAAGLIQYEPLPQERVVHIHCIYVPEEEHWQKGVATQLLSSLVEEARGPKVWFDGEPALALVTRTFPGEKPGQYPARLFFTKMGFKPAGKDPDLLYFPLKPGFSYQPLETEAAEYVPQKEDEGRALIVYGPSFCPFSYPFLKMAEQAIGEVAPGIPIRWLSKSEEPEEVEKRGGFEGCVVNARPIRAFVLDKEGFQREVAEAWGV